MADNEISKALDEADLFLRNRANAEPAPLNEYDVEILLDIAKVCDEAANLINRLMAEVKEKDALLYHQGRIIRMLERAGEEKLAELDDLKRDAVPRLQDALRRANEMGMALDKENAEQKEEIEQLKIENERLYAVLEEAQKTGQFWLGKYQTAKADGMREFARKLKCGVPQETGVIRCSDVDAELANALTEVS